jgi:UDP:flavonoid glycosyltransferase YjiC (YdhE family)
MIAAAMAAARRILLATVGSLGDLHPYLALGRELKRRGHTAVVATLRAYGPRVEAAGLRFHPCRPDLDPADPVALKRAMDRRRGAEYIIRELALGHLRESFADLRAGAEGADLVVTHPVVFAAQLVARASGKPWVSVALSPVSLFSATDPPVLSGLPFEETLAGFGPSFQRFILRLADASLSRWLPPFRALEAELGLPPSANPILRGQHSPDLVLALFSPLLAPPQADWPVNTVATGFPFLDDAAEPSPEVRDFLEAGEPPIVFTLGSAAVGSAGDFYEHGIDAAANVGRRALLLIGGDPANRPRRPLPASVLAVPYAPHSAVFPRAALSVHQGGIGTTGEAMRAGRPMLVVPFNHDQPDHARRLKRLGVARSVPAHRYDAKRATRAIDALLRRHEYAEHAREVGEQVRAEAGVRTACDAIERLLGGGTGRATSGVVGSSPRAVSGASLDTQAPDPQS